MNPEEKKAQEETLSQITEIINCSQTVFSGRV